WKYSFYTGQKFNTPKEAKDRVYLHSIESRRNLKLYKNDSIRIRARCEGKVPVFTMSQGTRPTGLNRGMEAGPSGSSDPTTRSKKRRIQRIYVCLGALKLGFRACRRDLLGLDDAFMKEPFPSQVLVAVELDSNNGIYPLAYALGIIPAIKIIYPSAEHRYYLRHIHENMKQGWYRQAYKDLLWRAASDTNVRDFKKCRAKSDLLLNNICEVFNGKIVKGRDKPVITLLEYIREYCMKRIVNVQGVIDKCTGPLTPTATRIMESIKKEAHLMKWELTGIPYKHVVVACWNMALNDRAAPPSET
ncbi:chloroplast stem-loop binding protein of 41 kDa b, chloroplastic, partial [Tanacetum coccineum]